jgi:2-dehydro-3-deoxyphosphooctonate aldolase (KDO 8-P synthase)
MNHPIINTIPKIRNTNSGNFFLIAGPCIVENVDTPFKVAETVNRICKDLKVPFIFKSSYRKANRSKLDSFTGIGDVKALTIINEIGEEYKVPTITDIHADPEAVIAADYVDILQIPAFLCRQTDLLKAAAATGKHINIKKGQFLSPQAMKFAVDKVKQSGNDLVMLTERGNSFGYQDLIVDMRSIYWMKQLGIPVILDITHSLQVPNRASGTSGGHPDLIETIAKAGIAAGADGIFMEVHPDPANAKSDGENMLKLEDAEALVKKLVKVRKAVL